MGLPRSRSAVSIAGLPARWIRVGRIAPRATFRKSLAIGVWYMAVLMSILLSLNRYGALVALGLHLVFLAWIIFASEQVEAQG